MTHHKLYRYGFTIVELLIVVIVIAILATIVTVGYNGVTSRARQSAADEGAHQNSTKLAMAHSESGVYPSDVSTLGLYGTYEYTQTGSGTGYCLTSYSGPDYAAATEANTGIITSHAVCAGHTPIGGTIVISDGVVMQTLTPANCPETKVRAVDARDNHTYWVQKLADGKCWMLTNLAYAGGGTNTYGDVMPTGSGTGGTLSGPDNSGLLTYTSAKYYSPTGANPTTEPTNPSADTTGGGTGAARQYGYLYNWCAAMGGQATAACSNTSTPAVNAAVSICPAGWRLPVGIGGEFTALNTAINGGVTNSDAGLRTVWLVQRSGSWGGTYKTFSTQNVAGDFWSSSATGSTSASFMYASNSSLILANSLDKTYGFAVRCVAR